MGERRLGVLDRNVRRLHRLQLDGASGRPKGHSGNGRARSICDRPFSS